MLAIALALLAAASNACASVLQRKANLREVRAHRSGLAGLVDLLRQPVWFGGIAAVILGFLLQAGALDLGQLAEVQPLMSLELPMTLLVASRVFHRRMDVRTWGDIALMTGGMVVFLFSLDPSTNSAPAPSGAAWAWGTGTTGGLVLTLTAAGYLAHDSRRAALLGVASGISFALTAAFMSGAMAPGLSWALFIRWQTYLVAVAGIAAMLLLQEGLQSGPLVAVQPGVTLSDPVVAVLLGVLLFAEDVRTGPWITGEVIGGAAVVWGAMLLSRSPIVQQAQGSDEQSQPSNDDPEQHEADADTSQRR